MIAALATLAFLTTLWLVAVVLTHTFAESGGKIVAALKGNSQLASILVGQPVPVRIGKRAVRMQPSLRASPKLRAAA
jgi:hypothetical protein